MAKADLTRDYYADLEISATATETEIKKQFRMLALKYHPDRNPGREAEVQSKFQTIQSAVEVLTDAEQRAKYDTGRARASRGGMGGMGGSAFASQARPASGFARGNPYANAGAGFAPPPTRRDARPKSQAPPPSAGANRYANTFGARPGGYAPPRPTAQDEAESRRKTYEAWNRMRGDRQPEQTAYERSRPPPPPPPQPSPQRGAPPPIPKRTGYTPSSLHDEPPAGNTSNYNTSRHRAPTAKQEAYAEPPPSKQAPVDPFKAFREQSGTPLEPRLSTPYSGRGSGEKTNPFESVNLGRSNTTRQESGSFGKSTRERRRSVSPSRAARHPNIARDFDEHNRAGSETNIHGSPKRTFSKTSNPSNLGNQPRTTPIIDATSSDDESEEKERVQRKYAKVKTRRSQDTSTPAKPALVPQNTPNTAKQGTSGTPNGDPKMYGTPNKSTTRVQYLRTRQSNVYNPGSLRTMPAMRFDGALYHNASALNANTFRAPSGDDSLKWTGKLPTVLDFSSLASPITPETFATSPSTLPFESFQGNILDKLVEKNSPSSSSMGKLSKLTKPRKPILKENREPTQEPKDNQDPSSSPLMAKPSWINKLNSSDIILVTNEDYVIRMPSVDAVTKLNWALRTLPAFHCYGSWPEALRDLAGIAADKASFRFNFNVDGQTYTAHSNPSRFPTFTPQGTEKINTTFITPEEWHGKFQAGDYFSGENPPTPSRASSSSSGAKHAPPKARRDSINNPYPIIDESHKQAYKGSETTTPQPVKSTPDEWKWTETFQPAVFAAQPTPAPPRGYSRSGTTRRQKHATAPGKSTKQPRAVEVESDDESDPLYMAGSRPTSKNGKKGAFTDGQFAGSPNAMDIDPPAPASAVRNVNVEPSRQEWRPGQPSGLGFTTPNESPTRTGPPLPQKQPQFDGQIEEGDLKTNLDDFKNTEPFTTPAKGLSCLADLKSALPFQSMASSGVPFPKSFDSKDLQLPPPPKCPVAPSVSTRPSSEVFQAYVQKMISYINAWTAFEAKMIGHFRARSQSVQMVNNENPGWIGTMGDAHLDEYLENLRQDEKAREWWALAVEKHTKAMEDYKWVKTVFRDGLQSARKPSGLFGEVVDGARA